MAKTQLNMSRKEFYESTAKEIKSLYEIHRKYNGAEFENEGKTSDDKLCFIDDIPWL